MSFHAKWSLASALIAATVWVAGCGAQAPNPTAPRTVLNADADGDKASEKHASWWDRLNLTDEQKTQIKAIKADAKRAVNKEEMESWLSQFKTLMTAETVDKAALTTFLTKVVERIDDLHKTKADALARIRDVLTPAQRQQVAVMILDKMAKHKHWKAHKDMGKDDGMSRMHRKAFKWMWHGKAAVASFMLTGDRDALAKAMVPEKSAAERAAAMADVLAGMTAEKRAKLVERITAMHERKMAREQEETATTGAQPTEPAPSTAPEATKTPPPAGENVTPTPTAETAETSDAPDASDVPEPSSTDSD